MGYDYYAEAKRLAIMLSNESLDDWSLKILSVMEEGVTATEILMMLCDSGTDLRFPRI
jgi:hypothetical protein